MARPHNAIALRGDDALAPVVDLLLLGERRAATALVDRLIADGYGYLDVAVGVVQPALYTIGRLWQERRISVADEHLATALAQHLLTLTFGRVHAATPAGRKALFACPAGNHHSLGLRIVSDAFELAGWSVRYLGADVPADALEGALDDWRPELLGLSLSRAEEGDGGRELIARLRAGFGQAAPTIVVGGLATNASGDLWRRLGADAWCRDARLSVAELG